jgi:multicomponent Na+:H+ antiporter subunit D
LAAAVLHVMNHAAMKSCLFLVTGSVELQTGIRSIQGWTGLGRRMPWTFLGFTLAAAAMVGIPPTSGFFSKWYLALGLAQEKQWVLLVILILSGLLTAGYFARIIERVFARVPVLEGVERGDVEPAGIDDAEISGDGGTSRIRLDEKKISEARSTEEAHEAPLGMVVPVVLLGLATLVLGLVNSWFVTTVIARALPASMTWPGLGG